MIEKRGQVWDTLFPWIIGICVLILVVLLYLLLSGRLDSIIKYLEVIWRFNR